MFELIAYAPAALTLLSSAGNMVRSVWNWLQDRFAWSTNNCFHPSEQRVWNDYKMRRGEIMRNPYLNNDGRLWELQQVREDMRRQYPYHAEMWH